MAELIGATRARPAAPLRPRLPAGRAEAAARRTPGSCSPSSTTCSSGCTARAQFRPFAMPGARRITEGRNHHGKRTLVHRRLRRRRAVPRAPPARARSPTATAARARCTPRSTRSGSTTRESRDSDEHPQSLAIAVLFDVTGSMRRRAARPADEAAAAARPAAAQGLRRATRRSCSARSATPPATGCRCRSASSSRTTGWTTTSARILLEGGGGGQKTESYELAMYFMARHTAIDCFEKRGRRGYLFIIGDEMAYPRVKPRRGRATCIGDELPRPSRPQADRRRAAPRR